MVRRVALPRLRRVALRARRTQNLTGGPMIPANLIELLADAGIVITEPSRTARAVELVVHAIRGCRFHPLRVFDPGSQTLVAVGRICPVCGREVGFERSTGTRHR
jgi:hypothetical protein